MNQKLKDAYINATLNVLNQVESVEKAASESHPGSVQVSAITLRHLDLDGREEVTGTARVTFHIAASATVQPKHNYGEVATIEPQVVAAEPPIARNFRAKLDR